MWRSGNADKRVISLAVTRAKSQKGTVFFIFNGFESKTNAVMPNGFQSGIVQPVLIWNCGDFKKKIERGVVTRETCTGYPKTEEWTGAAWADFKTTSVHGRLIPTQPGHTIEGKVEWSLKSSTWTITITDLTNGQTSWLPTINMIPNNSTLIEPVICLENYVTSLICKNGKYSTEWPQSNIVFTNFELKDTNNNNIIQQTTITSDYNNRRFVARGTGNNCGVLDNSLPTYDREHYYVYTENWLREVTFQTHLTSISYCNPETGDCKP